MVVLDRIVLSDEVYESLHRRAAERGVSVAEQLAHDAKAAEEQDRTERRLQQEISREREAIRARGVCLTEKDVDDAINWGRE